MTHPHNTTKHLWRVSFAEKCFILLLVALAPLVSSAQTSNGAPLPQDAAEAFDKGVIAAKQSQDYPLAIRYFQDARRLAPGAPVIYLNLGLAESKIPGRELRAIAWFAAYLEANPDAPNAAAVKEQIGILDAKSHGNLSRMIKAVQDAAGRVSDTKTLQDVAVLWAEIGDMSSAKSTADLIQDDGFKDSALGFIATTQAESGDITGAQKTADIIHAGRAKTGAQQAIAAAYAKAGDIAGAKKAADHIQDADFKGWALELIAQAQANAGDVAGAQKTADPIQDGFHKVSAQTSIAEAQIKLKDLPGANETCVSALRTANLIQGAIYKDLAFVNIASAQAEAGDVPGAKKTAEMIQDADNKRLAYGVINEVVQGKPVNSAPSASDWLSKLDDSDPSNDCALNTYTFLDLTSYLRSLPSFDSPKMVYDLFATNTQKIVRAQNVIDKKLKEQAARPIN